MGIFLIRREEEEWRSADETKKEKHIEKNRKKIICREAKFSKICRAKKRKKFRMKIGRDVTIKRDKISRNKQTA